MSDRFMHYMDHTCDIYHAVTVGESPGYGLDEMPNLQYPDEPDIAGQACHFRISSRNSQIYQGEPQAKLVERIKLDVPKGVDVRLNDKIVRTDGGRNTTYTAEVPETIKNRDMRTAHHQFVYLRREMGDESIGAV